ncbi:MAG: flagellar hook-length control protein FliK [Huintestinicola sp.]
MGEIAMAAIPAELMAAMNVFGGSGDMNTLSAADGSQSSSFDSVLGLLMANSAQVKAQIAPEMPEMTETESQPEMKLADILSEALKGNMESKLPEVFSEKGAMAFIKTLSRILPEYDGEKLPEETDALWETVSPEERSAFAELLYAAADLCGDETTQTESSTEDVVRTVSALILNAAAKPEKKAPEKQEVSDEAVIIQVMDWLRPVQTVSLEDVVSENNSDSETEIFAEALTTSPSVTPEMTDGTVPFQPEAEEAQEVPDSVNVSSEELRTAYEKLSEADPDEIVSFCRKLADKLEVSVKETVPQTAYETAPKADENGHIAFGRQSIQGFMARVNRYEELPVITGEEIIPETAGIKGAVTDIPLEESITEGEDVSSQIIRQIDLYKDIFRESFTEREISMKLSPESLGGIEIKIRRSDKGFEITFTAEKSEAAELIGNKASELHEALASRGIILKELSISRIVTNETDGSASDGNPFGNGELYGDAQNGRSSQDRHFSFGEQAPSDSASEDADKSASEINLNREAKLWISA